jgi:hypothetical protein
MGLIHSFIHKMGLIHSLIHKMGLIHIYQMGLIHIIHIYQYIPAWAGMSGSAAQASIRN